MEIEGLTAEYARSKFKEVSLEEVLMRIRNVIRGICPVDHSLHLSMTYREHFVMEEVVKYLKEKGFEARYEKSPLPTRSDYGTLSISWMKKD